jgi:hypothetical protein
MRIAVIALVCGLVIGGLVIFLVTRHAGNSNGVSQAIVDDGKPPIHPIVGSWRLRIDSIVATYRFGNDSTFSLTFTNVPGPAAEQQAGGSWRVNGDTLVMINKWSNTPLTVVGEEESAKIISVSLGKLVLENINRKGKPENLTFDRAEPFVKGKLDNPKIVGTWQSSFGTLDLQSGGDVRRGGGGESTGEWSQHGTTLVLRMNPPAVKSAARRAANPALTAPRDEFYEILNLDDQTLIVRRTDPPGQGNIVFQRGAPGSSAVAPPSGSRK